MRHCLILLRKTHPPPEKNAENMLKKLQKEKEWEVLVKQWNMRSGMETERK